MNLSLRWRAVPAAAALIATATAALPDLHVLDDGVAFRLIVEGFFDPVMQRIPFEGVRRRFQDSIKEKMEHIR